jgi:glucosamine--fructose-6-phosphate aminotransferase (isomerizing)
LACLAIGAGRARGTLDAATEARLVAALLELPSRASEVLAREDAIRKLAERMAEARDVLCLGRGTNHAIALEAALKLKEICYIHAEGYAAGEMKHGPIALIDRQVPVLSILPSGPLFEKTASNVQEAGARGAQVVVLSDAAGCAKMKGLASDMLELPTVDPFVAPILHAIAVQMLAYHTALLRGTDVDQPRNLAKSVTVE